MILDVEQHRTRFVSRFHLSSEEEASIKARKNGRLLARKPLDASFPSPPLPFFFVCVFLLRSFVSSLRSLTQRFIFFTALSLSFSFLPLSFLFLLLSLFLFLSFVEGRLDFLDFLRFPSLRIFTASSND